MKAVIDILTPKQARFFSILGHRLKGRGVDVVYTTRRYYESDRVLNLFNIKAISLGRFGETLYEKALFSSQRLGSYIRLLERMKPNFVISIGSPEAARAAFGLGIPHFMVSDSPHAEAVAKLAVPLSKKLFTPWIIPKSDWEKYGIKNEDIVLYKAIDQAAWIKHYRGIRRSYKNQTPPVLIYRPEEFKAAHAFIKKPLSVDIVSRLLAFLKQSYDIKPDVVVLGRYGISETIKRRLGACVSVPKGAIDGARLLCAASLFISGGAGTMLGEAALLGVPTISASQFENYVERYLIRRRLVFKSDSLRENLEFARLALTFDQRLITRLEKRSASLLGGMTDPTKEIAAKIIRSVS